MTAPRATDIALLTVQLERFAAELEPELIPLPDAPALWEEFQHLARLASGAALLLTRRVEQSRIWAQQGHRTAEDYLAEHSGGSVGDARAQLKAAEQLHKARHVEDAVRAGDLSPEQAKAIADAATANPEAERRLIDDARKKTPLRELKDKCARAKAAADPDPEQRERRIHRERSARWWTGSDGAFHFRANGTIADGSKIVTALTPLIDDLYRTRRGTRHAASRDTYAFDALTQLADHHVEGNSHDDPTGRPKVRHRAIIRVDHAALVRGRVEGDELCEITGLGPIPIRTARLLLGESTLHLVITRGTDVAHVTYLGRGPNAAQQVALAWTQPMCSNRACTGTWLQSDHRDNWADCHQTRLDNLDRLCPHCHRLKTYKAWALTTGTGRRDLVPPTDPRHPLHQPGLDASRRAVPDTTGDLPPSTQATDKTLRPPGDRLFPLLE